MKRIDYEIMTADQSFHAKVFLDGVHFADFKSNGKIYSLDRRTGISITHEQWDKVHDHLTGLCKYHFGQRFIWV